jgi:hypothetical protein
MKKIPTIFLSDWIGKVRTITNQINPLCQWVIDGEGFATRKIDGTCCLVKDGNLYKRREVKSEKNTPDNFIFEDKDEKTGKTFGWVPISSNTEDKYHVSAWEKQKHLVDGTYELIGKNIQGNPEHLTENILVKHGEGLSGILPDVPRSFDELKQWMDGKDIEGIVFHHQDGRKAKIKLRDFGLKRVTQ